MTVPFTMEVYDGDKFQGLFGSSGFPSTGRSKIKNMCANASVAKANSARKGNTCLITPSTMAMQIPKPLYGRKKMSNLTQRKNRDTTIIESLK